MGFRGTTLVDP